MNICWEEERVICRKDIIFLSIVHGPSVSLMPSMLLIRQSWPRSGSGSLAWASSHLPIQDPGAARDSQLDTTALFMRRGREVGSICGTAAMPLVPGDLKPFHFLAQTPLMDNWNPVDPLTDRMRWQSRLQAPLLRFWVCLKIWALPEPKPHSCKMQCAQAIVYEKCGLHPITYICLQYRSWMLRRIVCISSSRPIIINYKPHKLSFLNVVFQPKPRRDRFWLCFRLNSQVHIQRKETT